MTKAGSPLRTTAIRVLQRYDLLDDYFRHRRTVRKVIADRRSAFALRRLKRSTQPLPTGFVFARTGSEWMIAKAVSELRADDVRSDNFRQVAELLDDSGTPFFVVPTGSVYRTAIGVPTSRRAQVVDVVVSHGLGPNWYVRLAGSDAASPVGSPELWSNAARESRSLELFAVSASPQGDCAVDGDHSCTIQFWAPMPESESARGRYQDPAVGDDVDDPSDDDVIYCPRPNPYVRHLAYGRARESSIVVSGRTCPIARELGWYLESSECPFPVDVVYTWVDGADPSWQERRAQAEGRSPTASIDAAGDERFRSFDELKYSLRSLWTYVPFVRNVYVVTDRQTPAWLDTESSQLTVVDHTEIFSDTSSLPTFNSHAIESQLHHIDGLADHYLYLNDDVFFGRLANWETFFDRSGRTKFFPSKARFPFADPSTALNSVDNAGKNLQRLLYQSTGWSPSTKIKHTPHPQQRSLMFELEERYGDAYRTTMNAQFRLPTDVSFAAALHHRYGEVTGRAEVGSIRYHYVNLADPNLPDRFQALEEAPFDTLCLNDGAIDPSTAEATRAVAADFLERMYPYAAPWERDRPER